MTARHYLALLAGAMLATGAMAGGDKDHSKSADQKFEQLDKNKDESISKSEASRDETLSATFASVDSDGDGELSKTEYTAQLGESEGMGDSEGRDWTSPSDTPSDTPDPSEE
jgi:hypothetical protein